MSRSTIADLDLAIVARFVELGLVGKTEYAVGHAGSSRYGSTGSKIHLLIHREYDVTYSDPKYATKHVNSWGSPCSARGVQVFPQLDTDAITCSKCLKSVEVLSERAAERAAVVA